MKKSSYLPILILLFAVSIFSACNLLFAPPQPEVMESKESSETMMEEKTDETMMENSGSYVPHSATALAENSSKRRVLFFYANWCPTCRPANLSFTENESQIPDDVVVIRVNYNDSDTDAEEEALAEKYGITYQHTFVQIDENGEEVAKWNGGQINELLANIE